MTSQSTHLVFVHGWGTDSNIWRHLSSFFPANTPVSFLDLPGFGSNTHVVLEGKFDQWVQWIVGQIPENTVLVGWSLGGLLAQGVALSRPDKLAGVVCVCSSPHFIEHKDWPGIKPLVLESFYKQLQSDPIKTVLRFLAIQAMGSPSAKKDIADIKAKLGDMGGACVSSLSSGLDFLLHVDLRKELSKIKTPLLRIYGAKDTLVPLALWESLSGSSPHLHQVLFEQSSHAPFITETSKFIDTLHAFVRSL